MTYSSQREGLRPIIFMYYSTNLIDLVIIRVLSPRSLETNSSLLKLGAFLPCLKLR